MMNTFSRFLLALCILGGNKLLHAGSTLQKSLKASFLTSFTRKFDVNNLIRNYKRATYAASRMMRKKQRGKARDKL